MMYPDQIDPTHVLTMPELELSNALASTLVTFNETREIVSALAERWEAKGKSLRFYLRPNLKWSTGELIRAAQFKDSLLRAKELYPNELQALFNEIESIESPDDRTLAITIKQQASIESVLQKLTEPMFSLVAFKKDKTVDLSRSSGPYVVQSQTKDELNLAVNSNWYGHVVSMPQTVQLRPPPAKVNQVEEFSEDKWANFVIGSSIQRRATRDKFSKANFSIWERTLDKLFALYPSKAFVENGGATIMQRLNAKLRPNDFMKELAGYTVADQFYPRGYILWDRERKKDSDVTLGLPSKVIRMIIPSSYKTLNLHESLPKAIESATGYKVEAQYVPLSDLESYMKKQEYDILATGMAIADANFEGAISYFIEREPAFIPSSKSNDLAKRVAAARSEKQVDARAKALRKIMSDAQAVGHVVPLYHFSSFSVARPEIDLSGVPTGDETILFSKVRMK
jgi:MarR-like DNA-binding transcriptional regulator SgrR of sgrS sRNA